MTTKAFDFACLLPAAAPVVTDAIVCLATAPQLQTNWQPMTTGGAFTPPATGANQTLFSGAGNAWNVSQVPTDGQTYGRSGSGARTAVATSNGATMTSATITLAADPTTALGAATSQFVTNSITTALSDIDCGQY